MWFQDLWTYDFRRTEMCVIPYGTQEGEISFCAYNTGVGWRQIVENMHMVATTRDWYASRADTRSTPATGRSRCRGPQAPAAGGVEGGTGTAEGNGRGHAHNQDPGKPQGCGAGCDCAQ